MIFPVDFTKFYYCLPAQFTIEGIEVPELGWLKNSSLEDGA